MNERSLTGIAPSSVHHAVKRLEEDPHVDWNATFVVGRSPLKSAGGAGGQRLRLDCTPLHFAHFAEPMRFTDRLSRSRISCTTKAFIIAR